MRAMLKIVLLLCLSSTNLSWAFTSLTRQVCERRFNHKESTALFGEKKGFFEDLKGMFENFDDVVDDFVFKRMGAGEQWYGKRKYNPSGRVDGDYNGMGRSDQIKIEIARAIKEEQELKRQRRLDAESDKE